jgi:hypothetical protein
MTMFDTTSPTLSQVIEAAYLAMLALERRFDPEDLELEQLLRGTASEPGPREREIARRWLEEIQHQEDRSIHELDGATLRRYVGELSDLVHKRVKADLRPDPERGRQLLERLERQVPILPSARSAAR